MKKLALLLLGIGSLMAVNIYAEDKTPQPEPSGQEYCQPTNCYTDTCTQLPCTVPVNNSQTDNQLPCAPVPCNTDTVCNPAPCAPAPTNVCC